MSEMYRDEAIYAQSVASVDDDYIPMLDPQPIYDYATMCREFLHKDGVLPDVEAILPESLLEERIKLIWEDRHLKSIFPPGYTVCLGIIPFSENAYRLKDDEIKHHDYLRTLLVEPSSKLVHSGFSMFPNAVYLLFPIELQDCNFVVGKYQDKDGENIQPTERKKLIEQYTEAFHKLKAALKKALTN